MAPSDSQKGTWVAGGQEVPPSHALEIQTNEEIEMKDEVEAPAGKVNPKERPHWQKVGPDGKQIRKKPNLAKRNAMFRKHLQPKTAIMCLNELIVGLKYEVETLASVGNFVASVEVNGVVYRGYGSSKVLAKQAAAEAALVSFVKPPPPKAVPGQEEPVDETPWKVIASFAMYKLFAEWSEGNAGRQAPPPTPMEQGTSQAQPGDLRNYITELQQANAANKTEAAAAAAGVNAGPFAQPPVVKKPKAPSTGAMPQPAKLSEEAKANMHPVMVVNQLCPGIQYAPQEQVDATNNSRVWSVTAILHDRQFVGSGQNTKKAKMACAKTILFELFNVTSTYEAAN